MTVRRAGSRVGALPQSIIEKFRSVLERPDEELRKINVWAKDNVDSFINDTYAPDDLDELADKLDVPIRELVSAVTLIGSVLFNAEPPGIATDDDGINVLKEMGIGEIADRGRLLLEGIRLDPKEAELGRQKGISKQLVAPTLDTVEAVCDLRAIFSKFPSLRRNEAYGEDIKNLLGFEPIVLISLELNDSVGNDKVSTFQVNEKDLRRLMRTLQDALTQLELVKAHTQSTVQNKQ